MRLLVAALLVAGCATTHKVWLKDGGTKADFHIDAGQCRAQAFSLNPNAPALQAVIVYNACLEGKGWTLTEVPK